MNNEIYSHVIAFDRAAYNQGKNAKFDFSVTEDESQPTITARGVGGGIRH